MNIRSTILNLLSIISFTIFFLPLPAQSDVGEVVEYINTNGAVNWTRGRVVVESTAAEDRSPYKACRASIVDAQRDLVEIIGQVRVDSETIVSEGVLDKDLISSTVRGELRGGRVIGREMNIDGTCTIKMSVTLAGPLARRIFQHQDEKRQHRKPESKIHRQISDKSATHTKTEVASLKRDIVELRERLEHLEQYQQAQAEPVTQAVADGSQTDFEKRLNRMEQLLQAKPDLAAKIPQVVADESSTGLVIDVRGSNFLPSMSPKLRGASGEIIFPGTQVGAQQDGQLVSLFMNDLSTAQNHPRVGSHPLVVKALRTWDKSRTEIVLDKRSTLKVTHLVKNGQLDQFPIIIVLD